MNSDAAPTGSESSVPLRGARIGAFTAILLAGALGTIVGWRVADIECATACHGRAALYMIAGSVVLSAGVAVVAAITLRSAAEGF